MFTKQKLSDDCKKSSLIRKYSSEISLALLFFFVHFVVGCSYYKVSATTDTTPLAKHIQDGSKYFIVHKGTDAWHLKSLSLNEEQKTISGQLDSLPTSRIRYVNPAPNQSKRYKTSDKEANPTHDIHFYVTEFSTDNTNVTTIPLSAIEKIEIYEKNSTATTLSYVFGTIGIIIGAIFVISLIALALKSSCPFVYVKDGDHFKYVGEMFGGAIYSSLERDDFMPLPVVQTPSDTYQLKITNELMERQFINQATLIVIEHPANTKVLLDKHGTVQTIGNPQPPVKAFSDRITDYLETVSKTDSNYYIFNDENIDNPDISGLTFTFKKPANAKAGKLVLNVKNSMWLDYVYGKFNEQFGTRFNEFSENQKSVSSDKINQWTLNQSIPLTVYVKSETGWDYVDYFQVVGPLAARDVVMAINLSKVQDEEVTIKLECGFMFWDVDYAAMDFSENILISRTDVLPTYAIDDMGHDVTALLSHPDDKYLVQLNVGNETLISYNIPPASNNQLQSIFLHGRGYYEYIRDYQGKPDVLKLMSFKAKGSFTRFSKEHYTDFVGESVLFQSLLTTNNNGE